ncbi:hypothetical protein GH714_014570 [Hevea brasiliensis]|uniref:Reverse transcriptase Ty1/copia-type domain-containing protein n=1 Tax=Hevea brasiliensis TaxID=3981 RepID=A0A6A6K645_HEVBR|nr:hypothetical protein GH714_014570 [Hevea brasiliensis]
MKDLGTAKKILEMEITKDKSFGKLFLSQQAYVEKVLKRFNMNNTKPVTVLFTAHFKLSTDMSPKTDEEMEHMSNVSYSSAVGSIMYAIVCIRPDISHAVSVSTMESFELEMRLKAAEEHHREELAKVCWHVRAEYLGDMEELKEHIEIDSIES